MTLRFAKPTLRKLWDNYYVPYIKGWCSASGKFRSDDIKIGSLLAVSRWPSSRGPAW